MEAGTKRRLRVWDELRTAYIEQLPYMDPGTLLYRRRNYSFDENQARQVGAKRAGILRSVWAILAQDYDILELNEPLWVRRWTALLPYVLAVRVRRLLFRRPITVVAYAMENNDIPAAIGRMLPYAGAIASRIARLLFPIIAGQYSRIAFATREAQENYELLGLPSRVERTTIWPIPTRCDCLGALEKQPEVLFLSTLEPHKGIDLMFELWRSSEQVRGAYGYKLRVVGKGGLEERVVNLAAEIGDVIVEIDPPRARVHELLRRAKIVLLLSQPHRYWKEQVGLSLTEGLAHGCTIIATGETGLAPWLADHGHAIVDASSPPSKLAETLRARCETPVDPHAVLSSLSGIDGRLVADRWMANGIIVGN